ncbi:transcriptional repressor [Oceanospirillaceae bacterium]|jgi:Fur family zinc uptake transcriptional regulator|uniref:Fur family transcriptional regulator n=1 Tax=Candidatus Njordibacter sp. Uisw_002 TaxID=3230971 RepID=UPI002338BCF9|nr:transcriptional repressor [Oceanospirillaceae bacterium]MDB9753506.1 transcriptional repressor [Oceanospirillaceae bacterium]MDB9869291.1 transcriptional repressor [Oceanospirillaceae bacterium]MDC1341523.1 transcriptional repressor [Oceanospirillaceae bacterium]MDC1509990.1 transcriptional repressor [Oceanospirillaceae bacterium]|tara:strand:+ start:701 stop:1198 length:498 start_codon:yes stop_codon:yes gene_type:complete
MQATAFSPHDHSHCISSAIDHAQNLCTERGVRLTPVRQRVLELVWRSHQPIGAYELLAALAKEGFNSAPPTVYRALEFLGEQGLLHKLDSLNAYVGCCNPDTPHQGHFLLCEACNKAQELESQYINLALKLSADQHGFEIQRHTIEIIGTCKECLEKPNLLEPTL